MLSRAMLDDADKDAAAVDPPISADRVYANYLRTCRRLGVEPVPHDRAWLRSGRE